MKDLQLLVVIVRLNTLIQGAFFKTLTTLEELDWTLDCNYQGHLCSDVFTYYSPCLVESADRPTKLFPA